MRRLDFKPGDTVAVEDAMVVAPLGMPPRPSWLRLLLAPRSNESVAVLTEVPASATSSPPGTMLSAPPPDTIPNAPNRWLANSDPAVSRAVGRVVLGCLKIA